MKKIALSLMAIAITFASIAQKHDKTGKHKDHKGKAGIEARHKGDFKADKLNLNGAQKAQVKAQNEQFKKQMEELKASNLSDDQKKVRRKEILDARRTQMAAILTPEQKQKAQGMKKEMGKKHGERMKDGDRKMGNDRKGGDKMKEELGLTDAQSSKMKTINENFRNTVKSIRSNDALTEDQKKEQMKKAQQKHKEDIGSLLTNEQKDRMKNRPNRRAVK